MTTLAPHLSTDEFLGKVFGDTAGLMTTLLAAVGDRVGLFKTMASCGPATVGDIARAAGLNERYVREWLGGMTASAYLDYDPVTSRFSLPDAYVPVLAEEGGPAFLGGVHQEVLGVLVQADRVVDAFKHGGGIRWADYNSNLYEGVSRFTTGWFEHLLAPVWLEQLPDIKARLERGAAVADIGSGHGRALIKLAQLFPNGRYTGYDAHDGSVQAARANAAAAGVADRVRFEVLDASKGLPGQYDIITAFDVVHDAVDPRGMLRSIRQALQPDGVFLCLEINCSDRLEDNAGAVGAFFYAFSIFLCMSSSLAEGGEGLGTVGLPEAKLRELGGEAGFGHIREVPINNPFNKLYVLKP